MLFPRPLNGLPRQSLYLSAPKRYEDNKWARGIESVCRVNAEGRTLQRLAPLGQVIVVEGVGIAEGIGRDAEVEDLIICGGDKDVELVTVVEVGKGDTVGCNGILKLESKGQVCLFCIAFTPGHVGALYLEYPQVYDFPIKCSRIGFRLAEVNGALGS